MPTLPQMRIPAPKGGDEFEQITLAAVKMLWTSPNFQRHGRSGQRQEGVDLYGDDSLSRLVGVQCRNWTEYDIEAVKVAATEAEKFNPPLKALYFALTLSHDSKLQREVRLLNEARAKEGKFPIGLLFWEDVFGELVKNPAEFRKYYPDLALPKDGPLFLPTTAVAALDFAFRGTRLTQIAELVLGEFGQMANTPATDLLYSLREIGESSEFVLGGEKGKLVSQQCRKAEAYLLEKLDGGHKDDGWSPFVRILKDIQTHVAITPYLLPPVAIASYSLGQILSRWYIADRDKKKLDPETKESLETYLKAMKLDAKAFARFRALVKKYESSNSLGRDTDAAHGIYNLARKSLLSLMLATSG